MQRMLNDQQDEFYYITVMNENYEQPSVGDHDKSHIIKGLYLFDCFEAQAQSASIQVRLLGSGALMPEVLAAAVLLLKHWQIGAEVFSATSYTELAREARQI